MGAGGVFKQYTCQQKFAVRVVAAEQQRRHVQRHGRGQRLQSVEQLVVQEVALSVLTKGYHSKRRGSNENAELRLTAQQIAEELEQL